MLDIRATDNSLKLQIDTIKLRNIYETLFLI